VLGGCLVAGEWRRATRPGQLQAEADAFSRRMLRYAGWLRLNYSLSLSLPLVSLLWLQSVECFARNPVTAQVGSASNQGGQLCGQWAFALPEHPAAGLRRVAALARAGVGQGQAELARLSGRSPPATLARTWGR